MTISVLSKCIDTLYKFEQERLYECRIIKKTMNSITHLILVISILFTKDKCAKFERFNKNFKNIKFAKQGICHNFIFICVLWCMNFYFDVTLVFIQFINI